MSGKYGAILADPPWRYQVWNRDTGLGRSAESHYSTMNWLDIAAIPVSDLALPDCCLFMWATGPLLPQALGLGAAWGFTYKSFGFDWTKTRAKAHTRFVTLDDTANWHFGMGYWTRANTEICLLFTKGHPKRLDAGVRELIVAPVREHSRKPDEVYGRIERLVAGPYVELFARHRREGWDAWGNEIESNVELAQEVSNG